MKIRLNVWMFPGVTTSDESIFTYIGLADWYSFVEGSEWQPVNEPAFPDGFTDLTETEVRKTINPNTDS